MNIEKIFDNILNEYIANRSKKNFITFTSVQDLRILDKELKKACCLFCLKRDDYGDVDQFIVANQILYNLLDTPIFITADELLFLLETFNNSKYKFDDNIKRKVFLQVMKYCDGYNFTKPIRKILDDIESTSKPLIEHIRDESIVTTLRNIYSHSFDDLTLSKYLSNHGVFGNYISNYFDEVDTNTERLLQTLVLEHKKSKPSKKWLNDIKLSINIFGEDRFIDFSLGLIDHSSIYLDDIIFKDLYKPEGAMRMTVMSEKNEDFVRSVIWALSTCNFEKHIEKLIKFAKLVYVKKPCYSALQPRIGAALLFIFSKLPSESAITILTSLRNNIKYSLGLKLLDSYIADLAKKSGKTAEQLEDESVPHFDLNIYGEKIVQFGSICAIIKIVSHNTVSIEWSVNQKSQKTVPIIVKTDYVEELQTLKKNVKDIRDTLSAQIKRIESFYLTNRGWTYEEWRSAFCEHGLMAAISKPLIWEFLINGIKMPLMCIEGVWKDENENVIKSIDQDYHLALWHPVYATVDSVMKWRQILYKYEIVQPIKQAYREVYLLTEAELNTSNYSNRFAAHILKNYQFGALCKIRNWKGYNQFHGGGTPELTLKHHKLKVRFFVDFTYDDNSGQYITTDQVRFYKSGDQINLTAVPRIVLSEAFRDVDMFVGVCSIGNDPKWRDGGYDFGQEYWQEYSFGNLSESSKTRKEILIKLLPKLKIAKVSHIDGKFLVVKGKLRTYKIHLGSTNILMEPNNQYLCIVPDASKSNEIGKVFLPFDGDNGLSLIISKAFLLVNDDKISDPTIISQIKI